MHFPKNKSKFVSMIDISAYISTGHVVVHTLVPNMRRLSICHQKYPSQPVLSDIRS